MTLNNLYRTAKWLALLCAAICVALLILQKHDFIGPPLSVGLFALAIALRSHPFFKGFSFSIIVFAAVVLSLFYPTYFQQIGAFKMTVLITPLLQILMFGMGTTMSVKDFMGVIRMPKGVVVGVVCQFTIMPLVGLTIAGLFNFAPEIAAGVILIGSSPSGLASNVMSYLARANVALSVTLTAVATMLAPLMTPLLMQWLAAQYVPVDFMSMMWSIMKIVIIPVIAGLAFNHFFHGRFPWLDKSMPLVSMVAIAVVITIITAAGRDSLLTIGLALVVAAILHNALGYLFGYWGARLTGLSERDCRTVALEVGMQNAGLASGIALAMGKIATVGLAPAVFGPWMNISGSSLATWWRDKDPDDKKDIGTQG